jgi:hypothetical protein
MGQENSTADSSAAADGYVHDPGELRRLVDHAAQAWRLFIHDRCISNEVQEEQKDLDHFRAAMKDVIDLYEKKCT